MSRPLLSLRAAAVQGTAVFVAMVSMGLVGLSLPRWGAHYTLSFLPGAIALAATYRWGRGMTATVFLAGFSFALLAQEPFIGSLTAGIGLAAGAGLTTWLLRKNGFEPNFSRAKDVLIFLMSAVVGMTAVPTLGMLGFVLGGSSWRPDWTLGWIRWWSNTMIGVTLAAPALLAFSRQSLLRLREHRLEAGVWVLCVLLCCALIAMTMGAAFRSVIVMMAILLIVVGAIRFGQVVSNLGAVSIAAVSAYGFVFGFGLFGEFSELPGRLTLVSFAAALAVASLVITALLAERDAAAVERLRAEHRYQQIFNGSPQAIWVHDPVTFKFLLVNDAVLRQYGWSREELLAGDIWMLALAEEYSILPRYNANSVTDPGYAGPIETRHRTRDGRILDIEVYMRSIVVGGRRADLVFAADIAERRTFGKALIDALAGEQRRIAGEIHDGLGQELTGLALSLRALATRAQRSHQPGASDLDDLAKLATRCIEGSKRIVQGLSPLNDAGGSLESALRSLAQRASLSGTAVRFRATGGSTPQANTESLDHAYRIVQEAVQNALKHAAPRVIDIELWTDSVTLRVSVEDDGRGLPHDLSSHTGLGMRTMQFRARAIGGVLSLESTAAGTTVTCEAPLSGYGTHGGARYPG